MFRETPRGAGRVLVATFVTLGLTYGFRYAYSVFLVAFIREFGWSRSVVGGAFSVLVLMHGVSAPPLGWFAERRRSDALSRLRAAAIVIGVISNSNGSSGWPSSARGSRRIWTSSSTRPSSASRNPTRACFISDHGGGCPSERSRLRGRFVFRRCARRTGGRHGAVLFDPGRVWGTRDCPFAGGLSVAVELALRDEGRSLRTD